MLNYEDISFKMSQTPVECLVVAGKQVNASNFKQRKLANLYSVGAILHIQFHSETTKTYQLEDEDLVHKFRLCQAEYKLFGKTFKNGKREYPGMGKSDIQGYYKTFIKDVFGDRKNAVAFFKSPAYKAMLLTLPSEFDLLDVMAQDFVESYNRWLSTAVLTTSMMAVPSVKTQMYKLKLDVDLERPLRNGVTPRAAMVPYKSTKTTSDRVYINNDTNYTLVYSDIYEAAVVDAWLDSQPEFRTPTLDEQLAELDSLREWFQEYKLHARRTRMAWIAPEDIEKFERLEDLEHTLAPFIDSLSPEWVTDKLEVATADVISEDDEKLEYFYDAMNIDAVDYEDDVE